ncbi:hypothetical protein [Portibacter lacus]|uniref:Capsule assembly Wzi family protein n=1 Tax=Portibacter lacus TaxID=1099794 RepID=A0AA37SW49_9BACT|nr:hypothetical protein [Portibacter lacus]GLR18830.1 hypothetical protein GCM10007940_34460 [Portibacter lacus]
MKYVIFLLFPFFAFGQYTSIPLHSDLHNFAERLEIAGKSDLHTAINEFSSRSVFIETIDTFNSLSKIDQYLASKLIRNYPEYWDLIDEDQQLEKQYIDSNKVFFTETLQESKFAQIIEPSKPLLKYFYQNRNYFSQIKAKGFLLKINPIVFFGIGRDLSNESYVFENRRGIALSGHINDRVYFYSDIVESQASFPTYVDNFVNKFVAIPGYGFYKLYRSSLSDQINGYDFLNATAYVNARITKNIGVEFGNSKQILGNGNRSLLLSDFTNNYLYLKFNTKIWKLHYQNIYAELIPISTKAFPSGNVIPRKYMTTHYLSYKHKNIELGIFESVIFQRDGKFDLQYLNPVILYRLVEYNLASSDNVLVGANAKWNIANKVQLYGQIILDEFKLNELITNDPEKQGWWANKYGIQVGGKYINAFGIDGLDFHLEYNRVRPFTYGHRRGASYSHANQPLAHPLGANFSEVNFSANYYITPKLKLSSTNYFIHQGIDTDSIYYGADVLRNSADKPAEYGNFLYQGIDSKTFLSTNKISYEFFPNYFIDANLIYRNQISDVATLNFTNLIFSGGIRINFWEPKIHI